MKLYHRIILPLREVPEDSGLGLYERMVDFATCVGLESLGGTLAAPSSPCISMTVVGVWPEDQDLPHHLSPAYAVHEAIERLLALGANGSGPLVPQVLQFTPEQFDLDLARDLT